MKVLTNILLSFFIIGVCFGFFLNVHVIYSADVEVNNELVFPTFSLKYVAYPYDVPETTTTTVNLYTGEETTTTTPAFHVENRSIEISIKNQPFTSYVDADGNEINLYYGVQIKGHFENEWRPLIEHHLVEKNLEYTVLSVEANYPEGGQVDFKVQTMSGYKYDVLAGRPSIPLYDVAVVKTSGWSNTQTLTIENPEIIPEFSSWIILPVFVLIIIVIIVSKNRLEKHNKSEKHTENQ